MSTLISITDIYQHITLSLTLVVAISWGDTFKKKINEISFLKKVKGPILESSLITIIVAILLFVIHMFLKSIDKNLDDEIDNKSTKNKNLNKNLDKAIKEDNIME